MNGQVSRSEDEQVDLSVQLEVDRWNGAVQPRVVLRELYPRTAPGEDGDRSTGCGAGACPAPAAEWWQRLDEEVARPPMAGRGNLRRSPRRGARSASWSIAGARRGRRAHRADLQRGVGAGYLRRRVPAPGARRGCRGSAPLRGGRSAGRLPPLRLGGTRRRPAGPIGSHRAARRINHRRWPTGVRWRGCGTPPGAFSTSFCRPAPAQLEAGPSWPQRFMANGGGPNTAAAAARSRPPVSPPRLGRRRGRAGEALPCRRVGLARPIGEIWRGLGEAGGELAGDRLSDAAGGAVPAPASPGGRSPLPGGALRARPLPMVSHDTAPSLRVLSSERTELERSRVYAACVAKHQEGHRFLQTSRAQASEQGRRAAQATSGRGHTRVGEPRGRPPHASRRFDHPASSPRSSAPCSATCSR